MQFYAAIWAHYDENPLYFLEGVNVSGDLSFGTQLHGGFAGCSFTVGGSKDKSMWRYRMFLGAHLVVMDGFGRTVYEGRITDTSIDNTGVKVTATGYYEFASMVIFDMIYPWIEPTSNLLPNPSFEVNVTDGWTFSGGTGASVTRYITDRHVGSASAQILQGSSGDTTYKKNLAVTGGKDYTFSVYVKNIDLVTVPILKVVENDGSSTTTTASMTSIPASDWIRFVVSFTAQATTTAADFIIFVAANATPKSFLVDCVQVEQKPYVTPYCDGSIINCSWSGTPNNSASSREEHGYTIYEIVKDGVDLVPEWTKFYGHLSNADYVLGTQDYTDKKVKEGIESTLGYGYSESDIRPVYFAIWENRVPFLFPEPTSDAYPDWHISVTSMSEMRASVSLSLNQVFNRVYAYYDNTEAGTSKTLAVEDVISQQRYGIREGIVSNNGNPEGIALAEDLRDMALERYKYPRQVLTAEVNGFIKGSSGFYEYPYRVRAGDVMVITDLDMMTAHAGIVSGQAGHGLAGFVLATDYDAGSNVTRITFGSSDAAFETLMSRLGLSGGLS